MLLINYEKNLKCTNNFIFVICPPKQKRKKKKKTKTKLIRYKIFAMNGINM